MRRTEREILDIEFMHSVLREAHEIYIAINAEGVRYVYQRIHAMLRR